MRAGFRITVLLLLLMLISFLYLPAIAGCREDDPAPQGGHGERSVGGGARISPGWLWVRPWDGRRGGRGFREKGIWITTSGLWAGGIQNGLEDFLFITSLLM